ncbi:hypothetical protein P7K49_005851 [Saguinus oedipus]|uniref:Uncharacterized protein n=1 Tax=Saguinus oedipus TaxID=9490 RepID=A0ABQ9W1B2_SAGOE|nr:hypothetical protein P7K49_005851 [Saguinus oedipus]
MASALQARTRTGLVGSCDSEETTGAWGLQRETRSSNDRVGVGATGQVGRSTMEIPCPPPPTDSRRPARPIPVPSTLELSAASGSVGPALLESAPGGLSGQGDAEPHASAAWPLSHPRATSRPRSQVRAGTAALRPLRLGSAGPPRARRGCPIQGLRWTPQASFLVPGQAFGQLPGSPVQRQRCRSSGGFCSARPHPCTHNPFPPPKTLPNRTMFAQLSKGETEADTGMQQLRWSPWQEGPGLVRRGIQLPALVGSGSSAG